MKKLSVKSVLVNLIIAIVLTAVYMALSERFTLVNAAVGFGVAIVALLLTNKVLLATRLENAFTLNGWYLIYICYLFFIILKSAAVSLIYIFTKNIEVNLIPFKTTLKDDNLKSMLSNAITLTPGTVTADLKGNTIEVMKLCRRCQLDQTEGFTQIENILKRMEKETAS